METAETFVIGVFIGCAAVLFVVFAGAPIYMAFSADHHWLVRVFLFAVSGFLISGTAIWLIGSIEKLKEGE